MWYACGVDGWSGSSSVEVTVAFIALTLDTWRHRFPLLPPIDTLLLHPSFLPPCSSFSSLSSFLSFSSSFTVHEAKLADISTVEDSNTSAPRNSNAPVFIPRNSTTGGGPRTKSGKPRHGHFKRVKSKRVSSQDRADPEGKVE